MAVQAAQPTLTTGNKIDIHESAGSGCLNDVKAYLKSGGLIDKRDADRWTPLMLAVREGHLEVAKCLLRSGANLEAKDGDKWTAMHVAAANGHPHCCQLLLDRGANVRAIDENKRTPLHWATRYGYAAVVELLLKRGADLNYKDAENKTPGDVIGTDLGEDAREIVHNLLLEHAERATSNKQRRGSCPAVPRSLFDSAINASNAIPIPSKAQATPSEGNMAPLPLPLVMAVKAATDSAEPGGVTGVNHGGRTGSNGAIGVSIAHMSLHSHLSFSVAANIRDHLTKQPNHQATNFIAGPLLSAARVDPSMPTNSLPTSPMRGQTSRQSNPDVALDAVVGKTSGDEGLRQSEGSRDDEISALKRALQLAEERARQAEQSLSKELELRRIEERKTQLLEGRIEELEKIVSAQGEHEKSTAGNGRVDRELPVQEGG